MSTIFSQLSEVLNGTPAQAQQIIEANPGATSTEGLIIPADPNAPTNKPHEIPAASPDEVALLINGVRYRYWSEMSINRAIDTISTVDLRAPFSVEVPEFREAFRPFTYQPMGVMVGGSPIFTGTMVSVDPQVTDTEKTINVSGYAKCGVLADVNVSPSALPAEFNKQTLQGVAESLCSPFGVGVEFTVADTIPFERVALEPTRTILEFLTDLAQQRGLIIASSPTGALLFTKAQDSSPVARLKQGESPVTGITATFSPQSYFSHITGLESSEAGKAGGQHTVKNPHVTTQVRPYNFSVTDTDDDDVKTATEAKAGRMIGNMASYSVNLCTWRDPQGDLWEPGRHITLTAPDVLIYNEYKFLIRAVTLRRDADSMTATLELAMLGAFNGEIPETLPWAEL